MLRKPSLFFLAAGVVAACASPSTGTPDPTVEGIPSAGTAAPIAWTTTDNWMMAQEFTIDVGGKTFHASVDDVDVSGQPASATYTTLEASWHENDVEMRLYIYLHSDGTSWWTDQIGIYDGTTPGDWITFSGEQLRTPLGRFFDGDLDLETPADAPIPARVRIAGLQLQAFVAPACDKAPYTVQSAYSLIRVHVPPPGSQYTSFFRTGVWVLDAACQRIDDVSNYDFIWSVANPSLTSIAGVADYAGRADLYGVTPGETVGHVRVIERSTGATLAEVNFPVVVVQDTE